jgi:hypothetical protein
MQPFTGEVYDLRGLLKEDDQRTPDYALTEEMFKQKFDSAEDELRAEQAKAEIRNAGPLIAVSDQVAQQQRVGQREVMRRKKRRKAARQARKLNRN